jgi:hypothetical protein
MPSAALSRIVYAAEVEVHLVASLLQRTVHDAAKIAMAVEDEAPAQGDLGMAVVVPDFDIHRIILFNRLLGRPISSYRNA